MTTFGALTDQELIQHFLATQESGALDFLYHRYYHKVFCYCLSVIKNHDDAQDVTQDIFLKVSANVHKLKNTDLFIAWLFRIAHNQCMDFLELQKRGRVAAITAENDVAEIDFDEEEAWAQDRLMEQIDQALHSTAAEIKDLLIARYFYKKSITDLQKEYGLSESAVKMRLLRGCKQVLALLEKPAA